MAERARIATYFAPLTTGEPGSFHLKDDAAVLTPPPGKQLVITSDSVIENIHVLRGATPQQCAIKLMRRNLSDLAAMGATPWRYMLNVHTPRGISDDWFALFAATLAEEQSRFGLTLIGGDSTSGEAPIHVTMTCFGLLEGSPLRRTGAQIGDDIYVSGSLGDAAAALYLLQHHLPVAADLAERYHAPTPRLELGKMLQGIATAAIDISDGFLTDLHQLCEASRVGATIVQAAIPFSPMLHHAALDAAAKMRFALSGGDDYELLFTASPEDRNRVEGLATALQLPLARVGEIGAGAALTMRDMDGALTPIEAAGFEHL